jgi:hypothetical protein
MLVMMVWFLVVIPGAVLLAPLGYHLGYKRHDTGQAPGRVETVAPTAALFAPSSSANADDSYDRWDRLAADLDEATRWGWLADVGWIAFVVVLLLVALRLAT